jgi:hypothetical protein
MVLSALTAGKNSIMDTVSARAILTPAFTIFVWANFKG